MTIDGVWIQACVFSSNLSVLVNGSPTKKITIKNGLKQGEPLAPFLFLFVVEGLSGMMCQVVARHLFYGSVSRGLRADSLTPTVCRRYSPPWRSVDI